MIETSAIDDEIIGPTAIQPATMETSFVKFDVKFKIEVDPISLSIEKAVPIGLMLNELITNSFKHAFKNKAGTITIEITEKEYGKILLEYQDSGNGLPKDFVPENAKTMGLRLINMIKDEIDGELKYMRRKGFGIQLRFNQ